MGHVVEEPHGDTALHGGEERREHERAGVGLEADVVDARCRASVAPRRGSRRSRGDVGRALAAVRQRLDADGSLRGRDVGHAVCGARSYALWARFGARHVSEVSGTGKVIGYVRVALERPRRGTRSSVGRPQEGVSVAATDISYDDSPERVRALGKRNGWSRMKVVEGLSGGIEPGSTVSVAELGLPVNGTNGRAAGLLEIDLTGLSAGVSCRRQTP